MLILLFVDVLDDSDFMVMISLSVAVLCSFDLMLLLLDCLWKKNAAWTLLLLMFVMGNEKGETIKLEEDDAKKTNAVQ